MEPLIAGVHVLANWALEHPTERQLPHESGSSDAIKDYKLS